MTTPPVTSRFVWTDSPAGRILVCTELLPLARHAFTTRQLQFRGPDAEADLDRLAATLEIDAASIETVAQVHGRRIHVVGEEGTGHDQQDADAVVAFDRSRAVAVRVADCVPVLIADRQHRVVAAIHAGWRGTCSGISSAVVALLEARGIAPDDLVAAIGPSIGPCCYQVDDRVRNAFLGITPDAAAWFTEDGPGHWKLNLWQANRDQLIDSGVRDDAIHVASSCTADHVDTFFSYRKEGPRAGRLMAAIAPNPHS